jgi:16S rRNA processing protein RimM
VTREHSEWLAAGRVGRPHGLDGSFHVTRPRGVLLTLGATVKVGERDAEIVRRAGTEDRPILRLAGHDGREAAERLRGQDLFVHRSVAPPLADDEWYAEDLEGCLVVDGALGVGRVQRLIALPSCEALEVSRDGAPDLLIPLVRDAVRSVDIRAAVIDVDLGFLGDDVGRASPPSPPSPSDRAGSPEDGAGSPEDGAGSPDDGAGSPDDRLPSRPDRPGAS